MPIPAHWSAAIAKLSNFEASELDTFMRLVEIMDFAAMRPFLAALVRSLQSEAKPIIMIFGRITNEHVVYTLTTPLPDPVVRQILSDVIDGGRLLVDNSVPVRIN